MSPPVVLFRSVFRQRTLYAAPGWLLEEKSTHIVTATVPGAETRQLVGRRHEIIRSIAAGCERTEVMPWRTNRVVWVMQLGAAHAIGHFWNEASGRFLGYYINLQAPLQRSIYGFDSLDHVLDIVVDPGGAWRWKDEDEFDIAIELGLISKEKAFEIRTEGQRVIDSLPDILPTGWERWTPHPGWSVETLTLPAELRDGQSLTDGTRENRRGDSSYELTDHHPLIG